MAAAIYSAAFLTSQFFQFALGDSPLGTGLRFLPWTATPMVVAPIAGAMFDKIGARPLIVPGLLMQAAGFGWIVYLAARSSATPSYVAPFLIAGVGISMALPSVSAAGLNAVGPASLGKAAGVMNTMQQFGAVFGIAVATTVFNAHGSLASAAAITSGYRPALAVPRPVRPRRRHRPGPAPRPPPGPAPPPHTESRPRPIPITRPGPLTAPGPLTPPGPRPSGVLGAEA